MPVYFAFKAHLPAQGAAAGVITTALGISSTMAIPLRPRHLSRYRQLAGLLLKHGRSEPVRASAAGLTFDDADPGLAADAQDLARELEAMGPTFIKLGQLLSSRADLLPPSYIEALSKLQDSVAPFPYAEVERIVTRELDVRMMRAFTDFDPTPLAAGSLAQVHRATLRGDREVVVKVQRPDVRQAVVEDLSVLEDLASFLDEHSDRARRYALSDLVEQFRRALVDELDFRREAANLRTIGDIVAEDPLLFVPEPYDDYTTSRVLTMDYVSGRKVTELSGLAQLDIDGAALADALVRGYLTQVLVAGTFHTDPHPGNILVTRDSRLALIDLGQVARLAPDVREPLVRMFVALGDGRSDEVARILSNLGVPLSDFDDRRFSRGVAAVVQRVTDPVPEGLTAGGAVLELARESAEAGLRPAPELTMLGKVLLNLDHVAAALDPEFSPADVLRRHTVDIMRTGMKTSPGRVLGALLESREFAEALPGRINRAMDAVASGRFELRVQAFDETEFLTGLHKLANVAAAGLVLAALIVGSAVLAHGAGGTLRGVGVGIFAAAAVISLGFLARIAASSRRIRRRR
jgi:predicted unusual protein kinase regulating ubiquinone biosynthesis (AarF/ABC1/UbiB family)